MARAIGLKLLLLVPVIVIPSAVTATDSIVENSPVESTLSASLLISTAKHCPWQRPNTATSPGFEEALAPARRVGM